MVVLESGGRSSNRQTRGAYALKGSIIFKIDDGLDVIAPSPLCNILDHVATQMSNSLSQVSANKFVGYRTLYASINIAHVHLNQFTLTRDCSSRKRAALTLHLNCSILTMSQASSSRGIVRKICCPLTRPFWVLTLLKSVWWVHKDLGKLAAMQTSQLVTYAIYALCR